MTRIIGIVNLKGGVGKTTTCVNLGAALAQKGQRVLLVDVDPQHSLSAWAGFSHGPSVGEVLAGEVEIENAIFLWERINCWVLPAKGDLRSRSEYLSGLPDREYVLRSKLTNCSQYDFILIDTAPSYELFTINAICASSEIIIPLQTEILALESTIPFFETLGDIKARFHPHLKISGILPSMFDARTNLSRAILDRMRASEHLGPLMFKTFIRKNVRLAETPAQGQAVIRYSKSYGAEDYRNLAEELLNGSGGQTVGMQTAENQSPEKETMLGSAAEAVSMAGDSAGNLGNVTYVDGDISRAVADENGNL